MAVFLNRVILEFVPAAGPKLADHVRRWGKWLNVTAKARVGKFYASDSTGAIPIAYLWGRAPSGAEAPRCGAEVPLLRSAWMVQKETSRSGTEFVGSRSRRLASKSRC